MSMADFSTLDIDNYLIIHLRLLMSCKLLGRNHLPRSLLHCWAIHISLSTLARHENCLCLISLIEIIGIHSLFRVALIWCPLMLILNIIHHVLFGHLLFILVLAWFLCMSLLTLRLAFVAWGVLRWVAILRVDWHLEWSIIPLIYSVGHLILSIWLEWLELLIVHFIFFN